MLVYHDLRLICREPLPELHHRIACSLARHRCLVNPKSSSLSSFTSDKNVLHFGAIICSLGARYKSYCSNLVRTLLVNPTQKIQDNYSFLVSVEEQLLAKLVPGKRINEAYDETVAFVKKERPELVDKLTKTLG